MGPDLRSVDDVLEHIGVKGMKWGVHRTHEEIAAAPHHSEDAQRHQESLKKVVSGGGTHALSDKELKDFVSRMQLERQYSDLTSKPAGKSAITRGHDHVKTVLSFADTGVRIYNLANSPAAKAGLAAIKEASAKK